MLGLRGRRKCHGKGSWGWDWNGLLVFVHDDIYLMMGGRWSEGLVWLHNMEVHSGSAAGRIHHGKKVVHGNSGTEQQEQEQETELSLEGRRSTETDSGERDRRERRKPLNVSINDQHIKATQSQQSRRHSPTPQPPATSL